MESAGWESEVCGAVLKVGGTAARDQAPWSDGCMQVRNFLCAQRSIKSDTSIHIHRGQRYYQQAVQHCTHSSKACASAYPGSSALHRRQCAAHDKASHQERSHSNAKAQLPFRGRLPQRMTAVQHLTQHKSQAQPAGLE